MSDPIETEDQLIHRAQSALSRCNWEIGECASKWTQRYARGRTDADFGNLIGLSGDQVYQRRRAWETFSDVFEEYSSLKWSHFYAALNWDDASECLQWAEDMQATVAEMKAWRRAQHGEDLATPAEPEAAPLSPVELLTTGTGVVQDFDLVTSAGGGPRMREPGSDIAVQAGAARQADSDESYAPFGNTARGNAVDDSDSKRGDPSPMSVLRRIASALERCDATLTPAVLEQFSDADPDLQKRIIKSVDNLNSKLTGVRV